MNGTDYNRSAAFEHRFWLQILGDHARLILGSLPPDKEAERQRAYRFIQMFDRLLEQARRELSDVEFMTVSQQAHRLTEEIRDFKLDLIRQHLEGRIEVATTFLNHMVNEAEEYLRLLPFLIAGQVPPLVHPLHHHLLWLSDAAVHAGGIARSLDMVEKRAFERSVRFIDHFEALYLQAVELAGYLRANLPQFPALARFHHEAKLEIVLFMRFLQELEELELSAQLLGTLSPLITDHMAREECYYLMKLAQVTDISAPACDPAHPRPSQ